MAGTLSLVPYDPDWPALFEAEAASLRSVLNEAPPAIEHVGSTAIPGVPGKPVLDIAVAVTSESAADECIKPLKELG